MGANCKDSRSLTRPVPGMWGVLVEVVQFIGRSRLGWRNGTTGRLDGTFVSLSVPTISPWHG